MIKPYTPIPAFKTSHRRGGSGGFGGVDHRTSPPHHQHHRCRVSDRLQFAEIYRNAQVHNNRVLIGVAEHDIHGSAFHDLVLEMKERARKRHWRQTMASQNARCSRSSCGPSSGKRAAMAVANDVFC